MVRRYDRNMVSVTSPNDDSDLVDGAACVDSNGKYVSLIFGGPNDGTVNTTFKNIPSFIGSSATVKVEKIDWVSKDTVSRGPVVVSTTNYPVVNGQISVTVSGCNNSSVIGSILLPVPEPILELFLVGPINWSTGAAGSSGRD